MRMLCEQVKNIGTTCMVIALATVILLMLSGSAAAQVRNHEAFSSPQEAGQALFAAVQSGNEQNIENVLGGGRELISTDNAVTDQHDREIFIQKFRQMHRVVQEPDGTSVLYVGAENWPFPVPLISKNGKWHFDNDAGATEIVFRRVGEDEAEVIEICHRLVGMAQEIATGSAANSDSSTNAAAAAVVSGAINGHPSQAQLYGYHFQRIETGKEMAYSLIVAYPQEYRLSGVMTFIVTPRGLYKKDLGPETVTLGSTMTRWRPDRSWIAVH